MNPILGEIMYHIGKIESVIDSTSKGVISSDDSVQAVVRMWDRNLLILSVHKKIAKKIKKGNYVLNDYTPMTPTSKYRNLTVIKILPDKEGKKIWENFQDEVSRRKAILEQLKQSVVGPQPRYIR